MSNAIKSPIVRFYVILMSCILLFGSPISGYFLWQIFLDARASVDWPSVEGTILKARVEGNAFSGYHPDVAYSYKVEGREYTGTKVRASDGDTKDPRDAQRTIGELVPDLKVKVFYDPAAPAKAVLKTGAGFQEYALLVIPLMMFGMGAIGPVVLWRTRKRSQPVAEFLS